MSALGIITGKRIREKRLELGFTIEQVADILNCSRQLITHYEKGTCEMPIYRLNEFAALCDLPVDWFFRTPHDLLVWVTYL